MIKPKFSDGDRVIERQSRASSHARGVIMLVAVICLSIGIAIGAIARGSAGANPDDNRLTISSTATPPDALSSAFTRVAAEVEPCVAHIKVSLSEIDTREGSGSGVIVNSAGYILTNSHVVKDAFKIRVKLADGLEAEAKVVGLDKPTDLAVIKIEANKPLPAARMGDSDKLSIGAWVIAIGSPFGYEQTVTAGIISAKDRVLAERELMENGSQEFQQFLQTDACINPGNSGGPLVNLAGEVIGINTQIATTTGVFNGIGFALPSALAVDIYNQLVTNGRVRRAYLGINLLELPPQLARLNKIPDASGVLVKDLAGPTTPAARAGLDAGDIIISVNGQKVKTVRELIRRVASLPVGSLATIAYLRGGETLTATVKLEERQDAKPEPITMRKPVFDPLHPKAAQGKDEDKSGRATSKPVIGIEVRTLAAEFARMHGLEGVRGVFVTGVEFRSLADEQGIKKEDVIVEVNYKPIVTADDFYRATRDLKSGADVEIKLLHKEDPSPLRRAIIVSFTIP